MKIIILILSGHDNVATYSDRNTYKELMKLSRLYYSNMAKIYDLKYFYMEYNESINEDFIEQDEYIYIKGTEHFDKIYEKTKKSVSYVDSKYEYDYIVRTNISTFWNIHHLFILSNKLPKEKCLAGIIVSNRFISGTGIIISNDIGKILTQHPVTKGCDDVEISNNISKYCPKFSVEGHYKMHLLQDNLIQIPENIDDVLYFRVKNTDRTNDITCFKLLLKKIYNIHYEDECNKIT
jgi:hypothetical protein